MSSTPGWLAGGLAVVMIVTAVYCAGRLVVARRRGRASARDVDLVHFGMGIAMAGMFLPGLNPLAGPAWNTAWTLVFALAIAWFGMRLFGALAQSAPVGHHLLHIVSSGAMLYMLDGAPAGMSGMGGMGGMAMGSPLVGRVLTVAIVAGLGVEAVLAVGRLGRRGLAVAGAGSGQVAPPLSPRLSDCCHIAMSVTMAYMLLVML